MSSRRPLILMAVLLVLLVGYLARPYWRDPTPQVVPVATQPVLPGENSISNLVVRLDDAGLWQASFDYYYTGEPGLARIEVDAPTEQTGHPDMGFGKTTLMSLKRGSSHATLHVNHPGSAMATRRVIVSMVDMTRGPAGEATPLASARVDQVIAWPSWQEWMAEREFSSRSAEANLERAIALVDQGGRDSLRQAKATLERLIQRDASFERAYIELARVAMKTNWGPEGLHHAEGLLSSALQIKPDSVNAKILLGYVYTHQKRYKLADKLFAEAAADNPPNLWLWANWGEMFAMQGKVEQAVAKYREAVERPGTSATYERARADAYTKLLALLERRKDLDGMEALYKSGVVAFGESSCHSVKYARFLLQQRSNADGAIELARKAVNAECNDANPREVLGLAHYVAWSKREGTSRLEALNQARIYLPPGPKAMYLLAGSELTAKAAAQLIASGENIENKDNENLNALAHAVQNDDIRAARRLLRLGANPVTPVGYGEVPVALMPVMSGDLELVKLMQQFGVDYAKITYQGATAFDFAQQVADPELLQALQSKPRTL